jgi:hypothetical protein
MITPLEGGGGFALLTYILSYWIEIDPGFSSTNLQSISSRAGML